MKLHKKKATLFLFDKTGIMAKPWADKGYICFCFDGQHPAGITLSSEHKNIYNVGYWFDTEVSDDALRFNVASVLDTVKEHDVKFMFSFPECTDLAVSGAAHFAKKRAIDPLFQERALMMFKLSVAVANALGCPYGIENPVSVASTLFRKPDHIFHPWHYGGYLPENDIHPLYPAHIVPRDAYPKKTCIWSGNGFNMPERKPVQAPAGHSKQHTKLGGKSLKTKNIRSATPRGFALATFKSNHK